MNQKDGQPAADRFRDDGAFLQIFENMPDAVFIADVETDVIVMANDAACRMLGRERGNIIGRKLLSIHPQRMEKYIQGEFDRHKHRGEEYLQVETAVVRADGAEVPVDISSRTVMLNDRLVAIGVFRDITRRKLIEHELHAMERRFYSLLENVNLIAVMLNTSAEILFCNQHLLDLTGWKIEEVLRRDWFDLFVPDPSIRSVFDLAIQAGTIPSHYENEIKKRDGTIRMIAWNNVVVRDGAGRVTGTASIGEDITERTKALEVLRRYELLSKHARDIMLFIDMDGRILEANEAAERTYGYSRAELQTLTVADLRTSRTRDAITAQMAEAFERGLLFETEHCRKDGSTLPVEVSSIGVNIGSRRVLLSIVRDITERKAAENELEKIFTLSSDLICIADIKTQRFKKVNPAFTLILGYGEKELLDRPIMSLIHPDDRERTNETLANELRTGARTINFINRYRHKDGSYRWLEWMTHPSPEDGMTYAIARDITERKEMEERMLQLQKLESIGVLAGGIAHDFNNLLMGIMGNIALSRMYMPEDGKVSQLLGAAEDACAQAKELSYRLLTFSKGGDPLKRPLSLARLLEEAAALTLSGSNATAELSLPPDLPMVAADEGQIKQVFINVLKNAREAMPDGGIVRIAAETTDVKSTETLAIKPGHYVKISIADQGVGIPAENLSKMFDPYFTTKEFGSRRGRGLGLAICHSIMQKHGGMITGTSAPGKGTTIHIFIPAAGSARAGGRSAAVKEAARAKKRVLVMDDDERVRTVVKDILEHLDYEAVCASEGGETVARYREAREAGRPFDLVFLDLSVPKGMGGIETLKQLYETDPGVRAVVSSGYADNPIIRDFRSHGFIGAIAKPYNVQQLSNVLRDIFGPG